MAKTEDTMNVSTMPEECTTRDSKLPILTSSLSKRQLKKVKKREEWLERKITRASQSQRKTCLCPGEQYRSWTFPEDFEKEHDGRQ